MEDIKQTYIEIINKIELDDVVIEVLIKFIKSYDGNNEADFNLLMLTLIHFLNEYKTVQIKARGYEKIENIKTDYVKKLESLKKEYVSARETSLAAMVPAISDDPLSEDLTGIEFEED